MADPAQEQFGDRIVLEVVGDNFIPHGHRVSAYITSKFKLKQYESGHTWGHVDKDGKDFYYKEFLKVYTWQPGKEEEFKTTWNLYCQVQYKKLLHKWRKMSHPPQHVPNVVWAAWQSVWSGEKWKKNSETARKNRNSEVAGPGTGVTKHTAGSRSIIEHTLKLEADLKRKTDCWEVFRSTHRHKDGTFVDARSQAINTLPDLNISWMFLLVWCSHKYLCRLYGLGSQAKVMFPHAMSTSTGNGHRSISSTAIEELRTENVELKARMVELEKTTAENSELKARMADLEKTMRTFMSRIVFSQTLVNPSAFPDYSSPIIDSDETQP